jgi:hypothetical protein
MVSDSSGEICDTDRTDLGEPGRYSTITIKDISQKRNCPSMTARGNKGEVEVPYVEEKSGLTQ